MLFVLKLFGMYASGNCHKVRLLLEQLKRDYVWQEVDILKGVSQTASYLTMNPAGQVPVLEVGPDKYLAESNAILVYLAEGTEYLSSDPYLKAKTLSWLFYEQYSHEPYIAVARFINKLLPVGNERLKELPNLHQRGNDALALMNQHLLKNDFFVDNSYSIADIALYAYTHCAEDGGFDLKKYSAISAWLMRVESQEGFIRMT